LSKKFLYSISVLGSSEMFIFPKRIWRNICNA